MKRILTVALVGVAAMALVSSGCRRANQSIAEKIMEKAIEKQNGGKASVDLSEGKVKIKTKDGEVEYAGGDSVKLPEGFPKDIYIEGGAKLKMAVRNPEGFMVSLTTKSDAQKLFEKYSAEMKGQGWEEKTSFNAEGQRGANYEKEGRATVVMITGTGDGETQVTLSVQQKGG